MGFRGLKLKWGGKRLEGEETLEHANVKNESKLGIVWKGKEATRNEKTILLKIQLQEIFVGVPVTDL